MTADQLQSVVLRLANQVPTRYWLHFNYPAQDPWQMAVKVYDGKYARFDNGPKLERYVRFHKDMNELGGVWDARRQLWVFGRTNEDGTPFTSPL